MVPFLFAPLEFAGESLYALAGCAVWWPARRALLVADLHLEKASWYAQRSGQMLPPYDTLATLAELSALVDACDAAEVWCLGDSFHDVGGCDRLPAQASATLRGLAARTRWTWITGNHDPVVTERCGGESAEEAVLGPLVLRHEAVPAERRPELSGHFHPKLRVAVRGQKVARRCFVRTETKLILPAFGALTGGLDAGAPAIRRAVGAGAAALVPVRDRMLRFPLAA